MVSCKEEMFLTDTFYLENLYSNCEKFHMYVDRYCKKHDVIKEVAFAHSMVINAAKYYTDD